MRAEGPDHDEIDAVVGDEIHQGDLAATAALVHDLRSAYLTDQPLARSTALMAAMDSSRTTAGSTPIAGAGTARRGKNRKVLTRISALAAGVTGKIVLGAAVTAAAAGGLTAADVIDVPNRGNAAQNDPPGLAVAADRAADRAPDAGDAADETTSSTSTSQADDAQSASSEGDHVTAEAAQEKVDAAEEYTAAVDEWVSCVSDAADAHRYADGPFDPTEACAERPHPADFGLTTPPSQNHDTNPSNNARNDAGHRGKPESARGAGPESSPATADDSTPAAARPTKGRHDKDQS